MAKQNVNIGTEGNDATGDSIRESFRKVNENFTELYAVFGVGGQINFTTLSDTPDSLEANKVIMTNTAGTSVVQNTLASNSALDDDATDTITFDYSVAGKLVISTAFTKVSDDLSPTLGGGLNAAGRAIAGVTVSAQAAEDLNNDHDGDTSYSIDDLVITRGYADRRYIGSGLPIRIASEPANRDGFVLEIDTYDLGDLQFATNHGFDSGINGTAYIFTAEDTDPTNLVSGTTYYIRYKSDNKLSLFANKDDAQLESDNDAENEKINVSGTIASDDTHKITDAGFDEDLTGNFLSDVAMPRKSIVRRQGDEMTGALYLHDHPGELAGSGAPNGDEDLQAATKYYVDNTAYSSPEVLFVSTKGDDSMSGVPAGKEGSSFTYAYKSINAAARRAEDMIRTSRPEPGPYMQTMTYDETVEADVTAADVENPVFEQARFLIEQNKTFLQKEITGFLAYTYPDFVYDVALCERDIGLILDSIALDINRGSTANYLTKLAAQNYYSSISGRIAITTQQTETVASINKARDIVASILLNENFQPKRINAITKKSGDTPALVTTVTNHGLSDKNIVVFDRIVGMTELENKKVYVKVITDQTFEIFDDVNLTTPHDNSAYTNFASSTDVTKNIMGLRWQTEVDQYFAAASEDSADGGDADATARSSVTTLFNLVTNIIQNGIDAGADIAYGSRYEIAVNNGTNTFLDQSDPDNTDTLPGKIIRGKRSGALLQITEFENTTGTTTFYGNLVFPKDFEVGEPLEYGNFVNRKQVTIRVESGQYEEDYPIRLSNNVSLKGDEFRRVIIRPKDRISQSKYAETYFFRDKEFDGLTVATDGTPFYNQAGTLQGYFGYHYLKNPAYPINIDNDGAISRTNAGSYTTAATILTDNKTFITEEVIEFIDFTYPSLAYNRTKCRRDTGLIIDALIKDLKAGGVENVLEAQGEYWDPYDALGDDSSQIAPTEAGIGYISTLFSALGQGNSPSTIRSSETPDTSNGAGESGTVSIVGSMIDLIQFAFDVDFNPPQRNEEMDVFLMSDATIIRNVTVQGHGGFMCVLDPEGQVLTKSPYIQTATSFSRSLDEKTFSGGMYVDAYVGNLPTRIISKSNNFKLNVRSDDVNGQKQGLKLRLPDLPAPFYVDGRRYQINAVSDYDSSLGTATIYLDPTSNGGDGFDESQFDTDPGVVARDIFIQSGGNRSMLANDFTQINDLGYGLVVNNAAFSEQVSTFTYYCHTAMYANNGSEIRALNCSNGYGNFGLVAEGADPNEIPDRITLRDDMVQPAKAFMDGSSYNQLEDTSIYVYNLSKPPTASSLITFRQSVSGDDVNLDYKISSVANLSDSDNDGNKGVRANGDIRVGGVKTFTADTTLLGTGGAGTYTITFPDSAGTGEGLSVTITTTGTGTVNTPTADDVKICGVGYLTTDTLTIQGSDLGTTGSMTISPSAVYAGSVKNAEDFTDTRYDIFKLDIVADDVSKTNFYSSLQEALTQDQYGEFRNEFNHILDAVNDPDALVTRPSTAINFDESDYDTYRSVAFSASDAFAVDLTPDDDEIMTTFEVGFDFVQLAVDTARTGNSAPTGSGTMGDTQGDTYLAIQEISESRDESRLPRDRDGNTPPASKQYPNAYNIMQRNIAFVQAEVIAWVNATYPSLNYDEGTCRRDVGLIVDAASRDALFDGNANSVFAAYRYYNGTQSYIPAGQQAETVAALDKAKEIVTQYIIPKTAWSAINTEGLTQDTTGSAGETGSASEVATLMDIVTDAVESGTSTIPTSTGYMGGMVFAHEGKLHQVIDVVSDSSTSYVEFIDVPLANIHDTYTGLGLSAALDYEKNVECGLAYGAKGEITIAISLLRATGHDFTQIGTGSFNDSNYPNVILGDPENSLASFYTDAETATSAQVWERKKGRVFFVSTDQDGFFRVGKFFSVDQATGDITFAGEIGLSNANSLGFKRGVTINEFSADDSFADESGQAVPTEKAVANYISRRLGYTTGGSQIDSTGNRIGPGFLALNGSTEMEGNLDLGGNKIENVALPGSDGTAAANKNYVDDNTAAFSQVQQLRDFELNSPAGDDLLVYTGKKIIYTNPETGGTIANGDTIEGTSTNATGTVVDISTITDEILGSQRKIVYTPVSGNIDTGIDTITNGTATATIETASPDVLDEIANASEATASDINVGITRTASGAEYDLQIEAGAIVNADVNASAAIAQSKLNMNAATTRANATGITQADLGLASFDSDDFDITNGWVTLKANEVDFGDLPQLAQYEAIARNASGTGDSAAISFADIVNNGGGIHDDDFGAYSSGVNALVRTAAGTYEGRDVVINGTTANTLVERDANGAIQADGLILGGVSTYEVMDTSGTTLRIKTPEQQQILSASGSTVANTLANMPVSLNQGNTGIDEESTLQNGSGLNDEPFFAANYVYTNMIESHGTITNGKPGGGAAIGLGADPGFTNSAANAVVIATGGTQRFYVNDSKTHVEGNLMVDGATDLNGHVDLGNANTDNISFLGRVDSNVIPDADATYNLGSSTLGWNVLYGKATSAQYADLAENYLGDADYEAGTVVVFGGDAEVTLTNTKGDTRVAGVVSTNPAHLMNSTLEGEHVIAVALTGRVPTKVLGRVQKGDILVSSAIPGYAVVNNNPGVGQVIGKALENKDTDDRGVIEVVVGRV